MDSRLERYFNPSNEPMILFRKTPNTLSEYLVASKHFHVESQRSNCYNTLVVGRYSVLPHYRETHEDLRINFCNLVNSPRQHHWVADFHYYGLLREFTPQTWDDYTIQEADWNGPFVVKGVTNSKKLQWNSMMYAADKIQALKVASKLLKDGDLAEQKIIYRKYIELKTFEIGLNGLPFTNEWRFFFYKKHQLAYGYYWSIAKDLNVPYMTISGMRLAHKVADIVSEHVPFFCLDIAETTTGEWILIEVNDGQMSGLQEVDPNMLYGNLRRVLDHEREQAKV